MGLFNPAGRRAGFALRGLLALGLLGATVYADALTQGQTPDGLSYASGGIGIAERQQLVEQAGRYSFWLRTAGKGSGAYLAAVRLNIREAAGQRMLLEHQMDGPWFYAALPPGRYEIEARYRDGANAPEQLRRGSFSVVQGTLRQMVLYFDSSETVGQP